MHSFFYIFFLFKLLEILNLNCHKMAVYCNSQWTEQLELDFCGPVPRDLEDAPLAVWSSDAGESLKLSLSHSPLHEQKPRPLGWGSGGCSWGNLLKD